MFSIAILLYRAMLYGVVNIFCTTTCPVFEHRRARRAEGMTQPLKGVHVIPMVMTL